MPKDKLFEEWFWVDRWIESSAQALSIEARGLYREMLSHAWIRGARLPNDHDGIRRIVGCTPQEWRRAWPKIARYWRVEENQLVNDTQLTIYGSAKAMVERASERGRRGGQASAKASLERDSSNTQVGHKTYSALTQVQPEFKPPITDHRSPIKDPPLECAEDLSARAPARPRAVQGSGAGSGTFPRDHLKCSQPCGRVCLPEQLFEQFVRQRGGTRDDADVYVRAWHRRVDEAWGDTGPHANTAIGDDSFTFWRARWREDHPSTVTAQTTPAQRQFAPGTSTAELVAIARQLDAEEKAGRR